MLRLLRVRYARARMSAYVNGELPPNTRRFVARIIDEDQGCYEAYLAQRRVQDELQRTLPLVGSPRSGQLDSLWQQISAEMAAPEAQTPAVRGELQPSYSLGYGLAAGFLLLLLALPYAVNVGAVSASAVPHPQPAQIVTEEAPISEPGAAVTPTGIALRTDAQGTQLARNELHNTPAARTPGR